MVRERYTWYNRNNILYGWNQFMFIIQNFHINILGKDHQQNGSTKMIMSMSNGTNGNGITNGNGVHG